MTRLLLILALATALTAQPPVIVSPSPSGVANAIRPIVRWTPASNVDGYRVRVRDVATGGIVDERIVGAVTESQLAVDLHNRGYYTVRCDGMLQGSVTVPGRVSRFRVLATPSWMPGLELAVYDPAFTVGEHRLLNLLDVGQQTTERIAAMVLVNEAGEAVWWHRRPFDGLVQAPQVLPDGHLLFVDGDMAFVPRTGTAREMSWDGKVHWQSTPQVTLHHDIEVGPNGDYIGLEWVWQTYNNTVYEGDGIVLLDRTDGFILWRWSLFDHFDPIRHPTPEQNNGALSGVGGDWSHSNAVTWDPARSLIWLSVRHFDSLIGVEYPSGNVRVVLGRMGLGGASLMSHQHAPEIEADGSILLFDNGNSYSPPTTRVARIAFDEAAGTASIIDSWTDSPAFFDFAVGDADRVSNDNLLVTAGVSRRLIELTRRPTGHEIVWELRLATTDRWWIYRSELVPLTRIDPRILPFPATVLLPPNGV